MLDSCHVCGKPVRRVRVYWVELLQYGSELRKADDTEEYQSESEGGHSLGLHAVGPCCAKKLRKEGIWVGKE